jgi:hypothetical protein
MGLTYERRSNANTTAMALEGMTDSDFAPNYGSEYDNDRSTSGHLFSYSITSLSNGHLVDRTFWRWQHTKPKSTQQ